MFKISVFRAAMCHFWVYIDPPLSPSFSTQLKPVKGDKDAASKRQKGLPIVMSFGMSIRWLMRPWHQLFWVVDIFQVPTVPTSKVQCLSLYRASVVSQDGLLATLLRHDVETTYGCKVNGLLAMQQVGIGWEVKDAIMWVDGCTRRGEGRLLAPPPKVAS